jgi:hypothetical protein
MYRSCWESVAQPAARRASSAVKFCLQSKGKVIELSLLVDLGWLQESYGVEIIPRVESVHSNT